MVFLFCIKIDHLSVWVYKNIVQACDEHSELNAKCAIYNRVANKSRLSHEHYILINIT